MHRVQRYGSDATNCRQSGLNDHVALAEPDWSPGQTHQGLRSYDWINVVAVTAPETLLIELSNERIPHLRGLR
jgi:hypothetical protein